MSTTYEFAAAAVLAGACLAGLTAGAARTYAQTEIDLAKAEALGIRRLSGKTLTLYTDVPSSPAVDELPRLFELAVPQWERYFGRSLEGWRVDGSLMRSEEKFRACGLLPPRLPRFANGFSQGGDLWLHEQETDYYRRHLLLHEGTHAAMERLYGTIGPPWYAEGVAELLGTHHWHGGALQLGVVPTSREESDHWGRIRIVRDDLAAGQGKSLPAVMSYSSRAHLENSPYGWCWAAASFLDHHPTYRQAFRDMRRHLAEPTGQFNRLFYASVREHWPLLSAEWQAYVTRLDYGHDIQREAILPRPSAPLGPEGAAVSIQAGRGWQLTGVTLQEGEQCRIRCESRFQVADDPAPWISEANGVTLKYCEGRPLGLLLAAVVDTTQPSRTLTMLCRSASVGKDSVFTAPTSGALLLRINDHPSQLADNAGALEVRLDRVTQP